MSSPNITFMLQYTGANSQFVDYTNRDEAVDIENELTMSQQELLNDLGQKKINQILTEIPEQSLSFSEYIDYMNRSYATEKQTHDKTAVFNQEKNHLSVGEVDQLKRKLERANENGSLLWQGVVSFDNDFLAKQGLYDVATGKVDQATIKHVLREAMPHLIQRERLSEDAFWWGNIHLNTDNVHIHFGLSELKSNREKIFYQPRGRMEYRGNFSQKSIKNLKSEIFHGLINDQTRNQILRQEQVLANLRTDLLKNVLSDTRRYLSTEKKILEQAYNHLPQNKRWSFKSNAKDFAVSKFFINRYLDSFFENEGKEVYQEFLEETKAFLGTYHEVYSAEKNQVYEKIRYVEGQAMRGSVTSKGYDIERFIQKREKELRERLGNTILKSFSEGVPRIKDDRLIHSNLDRFSAGNRKRLLEQNPNVSVIFQAEDWQKKGFEVRIGEEPYFIVKPIYEMYDKSGNGRGNIIEYKQVPVYDISQMEENIKNKRLSLKDISYFSSEQLSDLIDAAGKKEELSERERQELGLYRYALYQKNIEVEQTKLKVLSKVAEQFKVLPQDQPYLDFKKTELSQRIQLTQLQQKPNYRLSLAEKNVKERLSRLYADPKQLPINMASQKIIEPVLKRLNQEFELAKTVRDPQVIFHFNNSASKDNYLSSLKTQKSILKIKHAIYGNNNAMKELGEGSKIKSIKDANAKYFKELNQLYRTLDLRETVFTASEQKSPRLNQLGQLEKQVITSIRREEKSKKSNLQQNQGSMNATNDFMSGLSTILKSSVRNNIQALRARERQQRREEEEEQSQTL